MNGVDPKGSPVFTIGHSTHSIENFIDLLRQHAVTAIADVRSVPYSRMQPQFNRESIAGALKKHGIAYAFLGKELGARSDDRDCYENGRVQYRRLARTQLFRSGIYRVREGSRKLRLALMCAERDPLDCHRTVLVSRELTAAGENVVHILADGRIEPHAETMRRLLGMVGLPETDLFRTEAQLLEEAYAAQEARIAYVAEGQAPNATGIDE
jgi:uncharacterized protein (DUF488 family)